MGRKGTDRLYQFVDDLVATGARELGRSLALDDARAREVMRDIAQAICFQYARTNIYVPADLEFELSKRDEEIWRKYGEDGRGPRGARKYTSARIAELAEEYRLTTVQIYCINKLMKQREQSRRQAQLPGMEALKTST